MSYKLFSLNDMLIQYGENDVVSTLSSFVCSKDVDREDFLRYKAIMMEKKAMSRTYIAFSEDTSISGYFSVEMKCMGVPENIPISNSLRKKLNINNETGIAQMYLLGQLARSDNSEPGIGSMLLEDALNTIHKAFISVGCRAVRVDCADELVDYYTKHGFIFINKVEGLNRLVAVLD